MKHEASVYKDRAVFVTGFLVLVDVDVLYVSFHFPVAAGPCAFSSPTLALFSFLFSHVSVKINL